MFGGYFDLACDLWIIRDFLTKKYWNKMTEAQRAKDLAEQLDDELAGYGLPDDYAAGKRAHIFATDECHVWLAACRWDNVSPIKLTNLMPLMLTDNDMAVAARRESEMCAFFLDGNQVVRFFNIGVGHERA